MFALEAVRVVREDKVVLVILTDRRIEQGLIPIPAAMAVGAVHHALVDDQLRCDSNIIIETATTRDPHHFAVLVGFGATGIYPFLAYETIEQLCEKGSSEPDSPSKPYELPQRYQQRPV